MLSLLKFQSSWWDGGKSESTRTYSANEVTSMRLAALDTENSTQLTPQLRNAQSIWKELTPAPKTPITPDLTICVQSAEGCFVKERV